MSAHRMLVFTNPVAGKEDQFHDWYDTVHVPDCLAIEGIVAVTRYEVSSLQASLDRVDAATTTGAATLPPRPPQQYLAVWDMEGDLRDIFRSTRAQYAAGLMRMSDVFVDAQSWVFTEIRPEAQTDRSAMTRTAAEK
jgi:hypothetical protein